MPLTCENLLPPSAFRLARTFRPAGATRHDFLTFFDAFCYLVRVHGLRGRTMLAPAFYCDMTLSDMRGQGVEVVLCRNDPRAFDVDVDDLIDKIKRHAPGLVLVYNYFGKTSRLYEDRRWLEFIKPSTVILSDFAHTLLPGHDLEFLSDNHYYVDSARKPVSCLMAHMLAPPAHAFRDGVVTGHLGFRLLFLLVYLLRNACLRIGAAAGSNAIVRLGMSLFVLHDKLSRPAGACLDAFPWEGRLYAHIDFDRIFRHRPILYESYRTHFAPLAAAGHIELFDIPARDHRNLCFFFARVTETGRIEALLDHLQERGFWADRLWGFDFDAFDRLPPGELDWAKSIIVFPYTLMTTPDHVARMAALLKDFFATGERAA